MFLNRRVVYSIRKDADAALQERSMRVRVCLRICICHRLSGAAARFLGEGLRHGFFLDTIRGTGAPVHASRH